MDMEANLNTDQAACLHPAEVAAPEHAPNTLAEPLAKQFLHGMSIVAFALSAFLLLAIAAGATYQSIKARSDARRFPQEGKSVNIGGFNLNINCTGQGSPTVVLEAGLGVPAISWRVVQREIAKFTRVCSYDRAGYDWSDPGPMPRTSAQSIKELHALLQNAGERPPYVLVGHSFGGTNVRIYNKLYPDQVAGMVLADTGHEDLKFPESTQKLVDADLRRRQHDREWGRTLYRLGLSRFMASDEIDDPTSTYDQQEWWYFVIQPKFNAAAASELENLNEGKQELRAAGGLGNKPLIVLIAENSLLDLPLTAEDKLNLHKLWVDFEKRLANLSSRGKYVMVPDSGHMIPFDRPDAILSAVQEVWEAARSH